jgi:SagB-type dehydrogenase family enzyme
MNYRRSPFLMMFWKDGRNLLTNYRTGATIEGSPEILRVLNAIDDRAELKAIAARAGFSIEDTTRILDTFVSATLVEKRPGRRSPVTDGWEAWNPAAGFFHFSTRNTRFNPDVVAGERRLMEKSKRVPYPAPVRTHTGTRIKLAEPVAPASPLEQVLRNRRTWRTFAEEPLSLAEVSRLLRLTAGVQQWVRAPGRGRIPLKTSPSGGACHPIETYVAATRVAGVRPGLHHYDAGTHELVRLKAGATASGIADFIQAQPWYNNAALLLIFTAVFGRTQWRYATAKAYRNVLLEAGHLCQTFYLLATEMELAPFCTQAISENAIDDALGLDGVTEGVVYVAGCGRRPAEGWSIGLPEVDLPG